MAGDKAGGGRLERLQKVLAARGVASRRAAEELILEGRVKVDGRVVTELGTKVDPERSEIRVGGRLLREQRPAYLLLNKPRGYITTASDPEGRRTVYDLLDPGVTRERVFPVGRLDMDSEGLLLLTNDGELANRVAHPRYRIDKEYNALVEGSPSPGALARLARGGFLIEGGRTSPAEVAVIGQEAGGTWLRIIIHEGRKRQVRRMLEEIGHPVRRLRRVRLGPLTLAGLPAAAYRPLAPEELGRLRRLVGLTGGESAPAERPARAETRALGARAASPLRGGGRARPEGREERPARGRSRGGSDGERRPPRSGAGDTGPGRGRQRDGDRERGERGTGGQRGRQPGGDRPRGARP